MPRPGDDDINIGLPGDQIMQRYLVRRIYREVEFEVKEFDGEVTTGFITGLDDKVIQMSTTPKHDAAEPLSVLIYWPVKKISETGRRLDALEHEHKSKIRSYSHALRSQCERFMNGTQQTQRRQGRKLDAAPSAPTPLFKEA